MSTLNTTVKVVLILIGLFILKDYFWWIVGFGAALVIIRLLADGYWHLRDNGRI
jgi:hypothetical protein